MALFQVNQTELVEMDHDLVVVRVRGWDLNDLTLCDPCIIVAV